jgi:hypothetical protein
MLEQSKAPAVCATAQGQDVTVVGNEVASSNPHAKIQGSTPDRAAITAVAIIQLIFRSPTPRDLRAQIEALLRDEFADIERQVLADTRLSDP